MQDTTMQCSNCGKDMVPGAKFCRHCGNSLSPENITEIKDTDTEQIKGEVGKNKIIEGFQTIGDGVKTLVDAGYAEKDVSGIVIGYINNVFAGNITGIENVNKEDASDLKKPWFRFFARMTDYLIVWFVLMIFQASILSDALVIFVWIFAEGILLSRYGKTPGKWLFNIRVETENGDILSFNQAIRRSFSVWFRGLAMGIPYASVATLIMSYDHILNSGFAKWDVKDKFNVIHGPIGIIRISGIILLSIIFIIIQST